MMAASAKAGRSRCCRSANCRLMHRSNPPMKAEFPAGKKCLAGSAAQLYSQMTYGFFPKG